MTKSDQAANKSRAPRSFKIDMPEKETPKPKTASKPPEKTATKARKPKVVKKKAILKPIPDDAAQRVEPSLKNAADVAESLTPPLPPTKKKRFRWSSIFWAALFGLLSLAIGLWVDELVSSLFARNNWLGWLALALTALLVVAALAVILRELWGLSRMAKIDKLRLKAEEASQTDDMKRAKRVVRELVDIYDNRPDTARGRAALKEHDQQIIDGADLIHLAERDLIKPLDDRARALVMGSAKRVSVVTAVSPRAIVDIGFVLMENTKLIRNLADLYGGRPGTFGFWRLLRNVIGHLAVTGSIAVGEGLIQQVVGHGLAARLSSKLGEGVINGLLTTRIGIAAIDVCRPLPFNEESRPTVSDFMGELVSFSNKDVDLTGN